MSLVGLGRVKTGLRTSALTAKQGVFQAAMAAISVERRLTAILAADVAGYSRPTGLDEEGTHIQLQDHLYAPSWIPRLPNTAAALSRTPAMGCWLSLAV